MTHSPTTCALLLALLASAGCASVPEVESRLKTLEFHPNLYVVQAGDTFESIAYRYRLRPEEIARLNPGLTRPLPGQRINVRPGTELAESVRGGRPAAAVADERLASAPRAARPTTSGPVDGEPTYDARSVAVPRTPPASDYRSPSPEPPPVTARAPAVVVSPVESALPLRATVDDDVLLARASVGEPEETDDSLWPELPGQVREEIVPEDVDIGTGEPSRAALDDELGRYVGRWTWPTDGAIARGFAPGQPNGQGVDIAGVPGQDVRAALDGTVVYSGRDLSGGGNLVIVRHDDDLMTTYSHADRLFVAEDDRVLAGDPIASLGWNAERESVLRFEVRRDGEPLDPMTFLPRSR